MAHTRSAVKKIRQAEHRRRRNQMVRSRLKTLIKKARALIEAGNAELASQAVGNAISALDKAAEKGILHRNNAARRKSRLVRRYNSVFRSIPPAA